MERMIEDCSDPRLGEAIEVNWYDWFKPWSKAPQVQFHETDARASTTMNQLYKGILLLLLMGFVAVPSVKGALVTGIIINEESKPIGDAQIYIYMDDSKIASGFTNSEGEFFFTDLPNTFEIVVYADLNSTFGVDYLPYSELKSNDEKLQVKLTPAASIFIEGSIQFIDSEKLPLQIYYNVQDTHNNTLNPSGLPLLFTSKGISKIPKIPLNHLIVPINSQVIVNVNPSMRARANINNVEKREFKTPIINTPGKGEVTLFDIREFSLPLNTAIAKNTLNKLNRDLEKMDGYGFYLSKQEGAASSSNKLVEESLFHYEKKSYSESFYTLKQGYIKAEHTLKELQVMYSDASLSVSLLIGFLASASLITGYLLTEETILQFILGFIFTNLSLLLFYYTYPGSKIISITQFVGTAATFFSGLMIISHFLPKIMAVGSAGGRVHTRNLLLQILNIAKRSLRRRKLRFLLTLTSIILLVMSFVTLTSFSEGYGIIESRYNKKVDWNGVFIREGSWTKRDPTFLSFEEIETNWIIDQTEVSMIFPKAQNTPSVREYLFKGAPIYGVIGISTHELDLIDLDSALVQGSIPDDNGMAISNNLLEQVGAELGETVTFGLQNFMIQGVFDDSVLRTIKDLDGEPYLPDKWRNVNPNGPPFMVIETCEPTEVIFMRIENALKMPSTGIQRIALELKKDIDPYIFAERLTLERGYRSYVSTSYDFFVFRLGNYFEGRGFCLAILWAIVVLNVIVTMLNTFYERRKEIGILSSVGLNPAQILGIFVAEASIIGFVAGGSGYLMGLSFYRGMSILNIGLQVHQKVSAVWSFASIGLAISAVLTGAIVALKYSVVITPSLTHRWKIDKYAVGDQELRAHRITVPVKLERREVESYINYIYIRLKKLEHHFIRVTSSIKLEDLEDGKKISFIYKSEGGYMYNFYTKNELYVEPIKESEYGARLESSGHSEQAYIVGSLIRRITMEFSARAKN